MPCSPEVAKLRDILAGLMRVCWRPSSATIPFLAVVGLADLLCLRAALAQPGMQKLLAAGVLHDGNMDPARLQPFTCLNAKSTRQGGKFFVVLNALERYSRAMVYLVRPLLPDSSARVRPI